MAPRCQTPPSPSRPLPPTTWPSSPPPTLPVDSMAATAFPWPDTCGSATPRPNPRLSHGWDTGTALVVCTEDTASATLLPLLLLPPPSPFASTVLLPSDTVCASVTLMLMLRPSQRLMRGTDMVVFTATVLALDMVDTALAMAMERGPLTLRPSQRLMPGTDTVVFTATVLALAMEGMAMVDSTAMERGPLTLTPSHGWDMVDSMAVGPMVSPPSWPTPTVQ